MRAKWPTASPRGDYNEFLCIVLASQHFCVLIITLSSSSTCAENGGEEELQWPQSPKLSITVKYHVTNVNVKV